MKFIYVIDKNLCDTLLSHGFNLLQETQTNNNNNSIWIFENNQIFNFALFDKTKYIFTNKLTF